MKEEEERKTSGISQLLPELYHDAVEVILSRLPVKSLLRFRCVSQTWKSSIDRHLSKNYNFNIYVFRCAASGAVQEIQLDLAEVELLKCPDRLLVQSLTLPMFSSGDDLRVVGSCDAVICLSNRHFKTIVLINPATREYRPLPPINKRESECAFGFGYDSYEYKVVIIPEKENEAYIYGSKSNTWRQVDVSSEYKTSIGTASGFYTHGCLHWMDTLPLDLDNPDVLHLVAFDLKTDKFTATMYERALFGNPSTLGLRVIGEKLWLCCETDIFHIWVMEEYGVGESWSELASFDEYVNPLAFSNCRRRLLLELAFGSTCGCVYHWYDLDKKSMGCIDTCLDHSYDVCLKSLIPLESKLT